MKQQDIYDIAVIGGGTTGLFATYYATMRGLKVLLIESQSQLGGKVMQFFPEKLIYDVGGMPEITGEQLVEQMIRQAKRHEPVILLNQWVEAIQKRDSYFELVTATQDTHQAKAIVLATGNGTFSGKTPEGWNDEMSKHQDVVKFTMMDAVQFKNKRVVISSDMKTGVEWALYLENLAKEVVIVNPDSRFNYTNKSEIEKIEKSTTTIYYESKIVDLEVKQNRLTSVTIKHSDDTEVKVAADELLVYHGVELKSTPFKEWGIELKKGRISVKSDMATELPGVFAAGDIVSYEGKTGLIASGYSEAITAVNKAHKWIDPKAVEQQYSTVIYR